MSKKCLNLLIAVCLLLPAMNVQAQSGGGPTPPPPDTNGMVYQDGVLTANPLPRQTETPIPEVIQGDVHGLGIFGGDPQESVVPSGSSGSGESLPLDSGEGLVGPETSPELQNMTLGGGDPCRPSHLVTINFDDRPQPPSFNTTVALRNEYRTQGVFFWGDTWTNGGAVVNDSTFHYLVNGYSPPNVLAFNTAFTMPDGGIPKTPETIAIMGKASYVEMKVASENGFGVGQTVVVNALAENGLLLDGQTVTLTNTVQTVTLAHTGIHFITINTPAQVLLVDDLKFLPETLPQIINFDDTARPSSYILSNPLRTDYADRGVTFAGPSLLDGASVLNEAVGFFVIGHSSPNFLAVDRGLPLANGGISSPPIEIRFRMPVAYVQIYAASNTFEGSQIFMTAYDSHGIIKSDSMITLSSKAQMIGGGGRNISRVVIDSPANAFILDDLIYWPENAVHVDFDDTALEPILFSNTTPLRNQMATCGVIFRGGTNLNGGAILNEGGGFSVTGHSSPNFLAFNSAIQMANGGFAGLPEYLDFTPAATYVEFYVGRGSGSGTLTANGYNNNGTLIASTTVTPAVGLQPVRLVSSQPIKTVTINSTGSMLVIDNLFFTLDDWKVFIPRIQR
jgi:hypothetical protein